MADESPKDDRIVVFAPMGRDASLAETILSQQGLPTTVCADLDSLCRELKGAVVGEGIGAVVLTEEGLGGGAPRRLVEFLSRQPPWSDVPLIVFARAGETARNNLRSLELLGPLGNVTFLDRPVRVLTFVSVLRAALAARRRQFQVRDLLRRLKDEVRHRDEFLAMLGHELRNPLGAIRNALHGLDQVGSKEPLPTELRAVVERQAQHLGRLVDDLLDVSRVTSGKIMLQRSEVDLNETARRCFQAVEAAAKAQRHALTFRPAPGPLVVDGDAVRLEQAVTNLLMNAIKYTPPGGAIELALNHQGDEARVAVRDNGVGITHEMLPYIFEPFTQASRSLDRAQGGFGIGLSLVRGLVERHGGRVQARSEGPGRGSEFLIRLPLLARPEPHEADGALAPRPPAQARPTPTLASGPRSDPAALPQVRKRILVVEDHPDNRRTLALLLKRWGHEVETAEDGPSGLARLASGLTPDVALLDIGLPGLDGFQLAREVRALPCCRGIFLVALTGYGQPEDRQRAAEAGFDAHLAKPVDLDELARLLQVGARNAAPA